MEIHQQILTKNDCYKAGKTIRPIGIMVHSTGADNPRLKRYLPGDELIGYNDYNNHWDMGGVGACVHAFIGLDKNGTVRTYQTLPWTMRAWHCGAEGNDTHISFEICEDSLMDRSYFEATRDAAAELCAHLCITYGFDPLAPGVLIDHKEGWEYGIASNHGDIRHWWGKFGYTMSDFRYEVSRRIAASKAPAPEYVTKSDLETAIQAVLASAARYTAGAIDEAIGKLIKTYHTADELPKWAEWTRQKIADGTIRGKALDNLALTEDMVRVIEYLGRSGLFGI